MDNTDIEEFIRKYAEAVLRADINAIALHFNDHFVLSTQNDYWHIKNNDEFLTNLAKSFAGYKKLGANFCKLMKFDITSFQSNHYFANLEWGLFDINSNLLVKFDISYCLKNVNGNLKYIFVVDHNEIERIGQYRVNLLEKK